MIVKKRLADPMSQENVYNKGAELPPKSVRFGVLKVIRSGQPISANQTNL